MSEWGRDPDDQFFISNVFNNQIWQYLNEIMAGGTSVKVNEIVFVINPNPASEFIEIGFEAISEAVS